MTKHKKLPDLELLNELFEYDPTNGGLFKKGAEHTEENALGCFTSSGHKKIHVKGVGQFMLHRIVFYMFHRRDPGKKVIDHINGDPADNRIHNLRACSATANGLNRRKKGKYVVDDKGVGRWVSGVVPC